MSKGKIRVRCLGTPHGNKYNFGKDGKQDWKSGGDILTVTPEEAKRLYQNGIVEVLDPVEGLPAPAVVEEAVPDGITFDQTENTK